MAAWKRPKPPRPGPNPPGPCGWPVVDDPARAKSNSRLYSPLLITSVYDRRPDSSRLPRPSGTSTTPRALSRLAPPLARNWRSSPALPVRSMTEDTRPP